MTRSPEVDEPGVWVEIEPGLWTNPATGGRAQPTPCGWCGRLVVWPVEGETHSYGRCVGSARGAALEQQQKQRQRPLRHRVPETVPEVPTIVITIQWPTVDRERVRLLAPTLAAALSLKYKQAAVNVRTFGTS